MYRIKTGEENKQEELMLSQLDEGIRHAVRILREHNIETYESCEGGAGHAYPEPTIRFHGGLGEGHRALSASLIFGLKVSSLRRIWEVIEGEPTGPHWEIVFNKSWPPNWWPPWMKEEADRAQEKNKPYDGQKALRKRLRAEKSD